MGHVYNKIWIHLVWTTKNRQHYLTKDIRKNIFEHIIEKANEKGLFIDTINGYVEHVHALMSLSAKYAISEVVNNLKGESSHWINSLKLTHTHFAWQDGYSAFSVSESQTAKVRKYIQGQEEHHRKKSYIEEIKQLYELHKIEVDEKIYFIPVVHDWDKNGYKILYAIHGIIDLRKGINPLCIFLLLHNPSLKGWVI
jgi:putative transposase